MDFELWNLVREAGRGEAGAVEDFVETVLARLGPDWAGAGVTNALFFHLGKYIGVLKRPDDFDGWLAYQISRLSAGPTEPESSQDASLSQIGVTAFRAGLDAPVAMLGMRERLARLVKSGWLPLFLICLSFYFYIWPSSLQDWDASTESALTRLALFCVLWPTLLGFLVSPVVSSWRRCIAAGPGRATWGTLVFVPIFFFLTGSVLWLGSERNFNGFFDSWRDFGAPYVLVELWTHYCSQFSDHPYLLGMNPRLLMTLIAATGLVWLSAVFAHYWFWVPVTPPRAWRVKLSFAFLAVWAVLVIATSLSVLRCCRFDDELQAIWSQPVPTEAAVSDTSLVDLFESDPRVKTFARISDEAPEPSGELAPAVYEAWLETGTDLWLRKDWYNDPALKALATADSLQTAFSSTPVDPTYVELEVRLRSWCVDPGLQNGDTVDRIAAARLNADKWQMLTDLSLFGLRLFEEQSPAILTGFERSEFGPNSYADTPLDKLVYRVMVGSRWQRYKDYRKTLLRVEPLTLQEREKMSEARVDLTEPGFYSKAVHDQMALNQALIVLICEGRRLKALGQPLPHSVEDLRPAVKDALKPYTEWLSLEQSGGTVNVGRWFFLGRGQKVTMGGARFEDRSLI